MAVITKKTFNAVGSGGQSSTTVFTPVGIELNNQDDLDVYVTKSSAGISANNNLRIKHYRQSTASNLDATHEQVNDTTGLYFPALTHTGGTETLENYTISTDNDTITFNSALPTGAVVSIERRTRDSSSAYTNFAGGSTIRHTDVNRAFDESNFTAQEARNKAFDIENKIFGTEATSTAFINTNEIVDDAIDGTKIADDVINSEHYAALSIDTEHIANENVTTAKLANDAVTSAKLADNAVLTANITDANVTTAKIAADNITSALIADDQINSEHYVDGSIDTAHFAAGAIDATALGSNAVTTAKINADAVTGAKIADDAIDSEHLAADSIDTEHYAPGSVDTTALANDAVTNAKIADDSIDSEHYVDGSIDTAHLAADAITNAQIADNAIDSEQYVDGSIDHVHLANDVIDGDNIQDNAVGSEHITANAVTDSEIATGTLDNRYYTETELDAGQLDNRYYTETESDARYFNISTGDTIKDGDTFPDNDTTIATTAAINDRIIDLVDDVGGFVPIASETNFPTANPDVNNGSGTLVSIKAIGSTRTPSGGTVSISNGAGSGNTVTITGCGSTVLTAGYGVIVETTSTLHTYAFHRLVPKATEVTTVAANATNIAAAGANTTNINTVAGISSNINTVAGISSNVTTVAGVASNVTTVAGISSDVTAVAADATDIGAVAAKATELGRLGTADAVADMNTLGTTAIVSDMDTLADISSNITTVAGISSDVTTVAGISSNVTSVANNSSNINSAVSNASNINSAVANASNINSAVSNASNINTVAGANSNITTVAGANSNISTVAGAIANVNTTASNISNVNNFAEKYQIASSDPSTDGGGNALAEGDLYFNTSADELKVYNGGSWQGGVTASGNFASTTGNTFTGSNVHNDNVKSIYGTSSDGLEIFHNASDSIINDQGTGSLKLQTGGSTKIEVTSTGTSVTGNIVVSGNVDGRDVAADGTKLDSIESSAKDDQTASEIKTLLNSDGIVNAQVDASAAIAGTKISPDFGSQNIVTTGAANSSGITITAATPVINFNDSDSNPDFRFLVNSNSFILEDTTNSAERFKIGSSGTATISGNLDVGAGVDVTGNITVSGTVDGIDIGDFHTQAQSYFNNNSSGVLTNGVTATTQSASDNSTKVATTAYTDTAISNLVDSSPSALNTLNELAAALGDDANFSTTVTNSLATKAPLASPTFTGTVTAGVTNLSGELRANGNVKITNAGPKISLIDSDNDDDFEIKNNNGVLTFRDATDGVDRLKIDSAGTVFLPAGPLYLGTADSSSGHINAYEAMTFNIDTDNDDTNRYFAFYTNGASGSGTELFKIEENGQATLTGNLDVSSGVDVTGNITVTGTVDGVDIAALNTTVGNITTDVVSDTSPQLGGHLDLNGFEIQTTSGNQGIQIRPDGTGDIVLQTTTGGSTQLCGIGGDAYFPGHSTNMVCYWDYSQAQLEFWDGVKASFGSGEDLEIWHDSGNTINQIKGNNGKILLSTNANNDDIEITPHGTGDVVIDGLKSPQADGSSGQYLQTNGSGQLSWATVDLTALSASNLTSGTVPDARFPATLPAVSGASLTNLPSQTDNNFTTTLKNKLDGIAASATNVTNNNQISNGAGYTTYTSNQATNTSSSVTFASVTSSGNITAYSDKRLKTDIHTIDNALEIVGKLRGVNYKWLNNGQSDVGVIAQEVEAVVPEVVKETDNGTKTVDYGRLVCVLIESVKELTAKVNELENK